MPEAPVLATHMNARAAASKTTRRMDTFQRRPPGAFTASRIPLRRRNEPARGAGTMSATVEKLERDDTDRMHPAFFSIGSIALIAPLCVVGAIIGTQLIVTLGITTNTSLIGALAGMGLARVPLLVFARYRSVHMQNLAQSAISAATFGAGNALLLPIGIPFVHGPRRIWCCPCSSVSFWR